MARLSKNRKNSQLLLTLVTAIIFAAISIPSAVASDDIDVSVRIPELADSGSQTEISNAELRWAINHESGSGAFYGGCNFMIAGTPGANGNTGNGKVWTAEDGFYQATDGNVTIVKPDKNGQYQNATFATRCQDQEGTTVSTANNLSTQSQVVIDGGKGLLDHKTGTATIKWSGTFTVVYYGGLTYWWVSDPVLQINKDGTASLTGTAGGYGTSMENTSKWEKLPETKITLAELNGISTLNEQGFAATSQSETKCQTNCQRYLGRSIKTAAGITDQTKKNSENESYWGAFPQDFIDFHGKTGQSAYWYTSGGIRDWAKVPEPLYISYDATNAIDNVPSTTVVPTSTPLTQSNTINVSSSMLPNQTLTARANTKAASSDTQDTKSNSFTAVPAVTIGNGIDSLIPEVSNWVTDPNRRMWTMTAIVLLAASGAVIGFRKRWLILPFMK